MIEHYADDVLERSRRLYDAIGQWGRERGDVTLIGGWAVYEHVLPGNAQQSRDIDLVMHDEAALDAFSSHLRGWGLQWRVHGRNRFNDCHLVGDPKKEIVVDVLKASDFPDTIFKGMAMRGADPVKPIPRGWLPDIEFLIRDKLRTVPMRVRDAEDKRLKDLIDVHNLVFFNKGMRAPAGLRGALEGIDLRVLRPYFEAVNLRDETHRGGGYRDALARLERFLWAPEGRSGSGVSFLH